MSNFFKILFGSCLGTILALVLLFFVGAGAVGSIAAKAGEKSVSVKANSILRLDLNQVPELTGNAPVESPFAVTSFSDLDKQVLGVHDIVRLIDDAADNDNIKGIYINEMSSSVTFTKLRSIREALVRFKESGKFTVAYAPVYEQSAYYLASACDEVYLGPLGVVDFRGLGADIPFLKNMLDKVGVKFEIFWAGDYKSATEPLRRTEISPANREQTKEFLEDLFAVMLTDIGTSRKIDPAQLRTYASEITGWKDQQAVDANLVNGILHRSEVDEILHERLGMDPDEKINSVGINDYFAARLKTQQGGGDNEVAVLIAEGSIVDGSGELGSIGDKKYVNEIEKLKEDDDVKAVVLRVNSGGGSASSSENMWYAIEELKAAGKPVVVSMGDYAASGGYYIAANADKIYAEPTTITGSIGVFLTFPIAKELMNDKIGITFDTVNTARNATAFSPFRDLGQEERDLLNMRTQSIYTTFIQRVADGRNLSAERVREIAGGRVYSGTRALELGLVDELAGLDAAIAHAAELADLGERDDYTVGHYPQMKAPLQQLLEDIMGDDKGDNLTEAMVRRQIGPENYQYFQLLRDITQTQGAQARLPLVVKF